jgi:hypothetical protein
MAVYAGYWGPEPLWWAASGTPVRDTPITVLDGVTLLPTTLYTDETKVTTAPNPVTTDERGNLSFFAVPGEYYLHWAGALEDLFIVVNVHPNDPAGSGGGITDHGLLTGLGDDDHLQYLTTARGDARYYSQAQVDTALSGKANTSHTHPSSQITDFTTAVDARIQNVIGTAPAALDTLGELSDALGDDANFAATMTTALAGKQPVDADLTAIATLAPADGSVLARVAGAWSSRTAVQLKSDLGLTAVDVGLANVNNTSDANKPISTATQTALNAKASVAATNGLAASWGLAALTGDPLSHTANGSWANGQIVACMLTVLPGIPFSRIAVARRSATVYAATGIVSQLGLYDDTGVQVATTPADPDLWIANDWYAATLSSPDPGTASVLRFFYILALIGGTNGANVCTLTDASDTPALQHSFGSTKRKCFYLGGQSALPASFNPNTTGTETTSRPLFGLAA